MSDHMSACEVRPNVMRLMVHKVFLKDSDRLSVMAVSELCSVMVDELPCYCHRYFKLPKKIPE